MKKAHFFGLMTLTVVCLTAGFFAGRESLRYEIRSALQNTISNVLNPAAATKAAEPVVSLKQPPLILPTLINKDFHQANPSAGDFQSYMLATVSFQNDSGRDIRAFDGVLTFTDLLDNEILSAKVAINELIKAGGRLTWNGQMEYNQFMSSHREFVAEQLSNFKIKLRVEKILYTDGSTVVVAK